MKRPEVRKAEGGRLLPSQTADALQEKARHFREECEAALRDIRRTLASVQKGLEQESRRLS